VGQREIARADHHNGVRLPAANTRSKRLGRIPCTHSVRFAIRRPHPACTELM
jgi:hypothetical protein